MTFIIIIIIIISYIYLTSHLLLAVQIFDGS